MYTPTERTERSKENLSLDLFRTSTDNNWRKKEKVKERGEKVRREKENSTW